MMEKKCIICGKKFKTNNPGQITCSAACLKENSVRKAREYACRFKAMLDFANSFHKDKSIDEKRKEIISSIRKELLNYTAEMAEKTVAETKMGRVKDKIFKQKIIKKPHQGLCLNKHVSYS